MLPTQEGGRSTPFRTNYRPQLYLTDPAISTSCFIHNIDGRDEVGPGETATVEASLLNAAILDEALKVEMKFWLREGGRPVGWGIIERLI
jgi:elongation factor Tu